MEKKLSDKINVVLNNAMKSAEAVDKKDQFDETIWRIIRELSENNWYRGRTSRTLAAKKIHQIAESKDKQARRFMKALNKAARTIALHLEKRKK
jgi:transcription initiation factor TFIIIB Brf1 subunit/transcription initiation factor TFIIB